MPASGTEDVRARAGPEDELSVYVHWPFCRSKCPYCDFNSHVAETVEHARWRRALLAELDHFAEGLEKGPGSRRVATVFFGGGTPSLMAPETAAAVVERVKALWPAAGDPEITLEANPSSIEAERFRAFRDAEVNRVSLGVQSLRPGSLAFLGRRHSVEEARAAVATAAKTFARFSFDLIYGLPGQTQGAWREELTEAVAMAGEHVSAYQLTIEPGTAFHRDRVQAAPEDLGATLYGTTQDVLAGAELMAYEVSNHAHGGAECRHNLAVWRGGEYVGVGPGAHGRLRAADGTGEMTYQVRAPERWLAQVEAEGHGTAKRHALSVRARAEEMVMTGLRLSEGVARERFLGLAGIALDDVIDPSALGRLIEGGFMEDDGAAIRATAEGRLRLDAVTGRLLAAV